MQTTTKLWRAFRENAAANLRALPEHVDGASETWRAHGKVLEEYEQEKEQEGLRKNGKRA